ATADVLTPDLFQEFLDVVSRLAALWDLAGAVESPWERCLDPGATPEAREEWTRMLEEASAVLRDLRRAADSLAHTRGLPAPAAPAEVRRPLEIDDLMGEVGDVPKHWVAELDLEAAQGLAESWRQLTASYRTENDALRERFQPELFELPEDPLEQL